MTISIISILFYKWNCPVFPPYSFSYTESIRTNNLLILSLFILPHSHVLTSLLTLFYIVNVTITLLYIPLIPLLVPPLIVLTWLTNILIFPKSPPTLYLYLHQQGQTWVEKNLLVDFTLNQSHCISLVHSLSHSMIVISYFFLSLQTYTVIPLRHLSFHWWTF